MVDQPSNAQHRGLFDGMPEEQRAQLETLFEPSSVLAGTVIFEEGEAADRLYLVKSGEVHIVTAEFGIVLSKVGPGEEFGAMAVLDRGRRSARAVAGRDTELLSLPRDALERLSAAQPESAYGSLLRRIYRHQNEQLRRVNLGSVDALRGQLAQERKRAGLASFLTHMIAVLCVYGFLLRVGPSGRSGDDVFNFVFAAAVLLAFVLVQLRMVLQSGYPLATYGLTLRNAGRHALEAVPWTLAFLAAATLLKWALLRTVPGWQGESLFAMPGFTGREPLASVLALAASAALVPAQEFVGRGAIQGSLEEFLPGPHAPLKANLIANLIISTIQLHLSPVAALLSFFPGVLWGHLFSRQRSLVGVSVSHATIGAYLGFFVGFPRSLAG